jgi:hypothetical protein
MSRKEKNETQKTTNPAGQAVRVVDFAHPVPTRES